MDRREKVAERLRAKVKAREQSKIEGGIEGMRERAEREACVQQLKQKEEKAKHDEAMARHVKAMRKIEHGIKKKYDDELFMKLIMAELNKSELALKPGKLAELKLLVRAIN